MVMDGLSVTLCKLAQEFLYLYIHPKWLLNLKFRMVA